MTIHHHRVRHDVCLSCWFLHKIVLASQWTVISFILPSLSWNYQERKQAFKHLMCRAWLLIWIDHDLFSTQRVSVFIRKRGSAAVLENYLKWAQVDLFDFDDDNIYINIYWYLDGATVWKIRFCPIVAWNNFVLLWYSCWSRCVRNACKFCWRSWIPAEPMVGGGGEVDWSAAQSRAGWFSWL